MGSVCVCLKFALAVPPLLGRRLRRASGGFHIWKAGIVTVGAVLFSAFPLFSPAIRRSSAACFRTVGLATGLFRDEMQRQRGSI